MYVQSIIQLFANKRAMSLCVKGVQLWNSMCDDLKIVNTVAAFKRKCKNLLFKKYLVERNRETRYYSIYRCDEV